MKDTGGDRPIACTLSDSAFQDREAAWRSVVDAGLLVKRPIANGVRLEFAPAHEVMHALADLVAVERECCPWASWTLIATEATTSVEVTADDGAGAVAARELFDVATAQIEPIRDGAAR
jgi:hypothetical protein